MMASELRLVPPGYAILAICLWISIGSFVGLVVAAATLKEAAGQIRPVLLGVVLPASRDHLPRLLWGMLSGLIVGGAFSLSDAFLIDSVTCDGSHLRLTSLVGMTDIDLRDGKLGLETQSARWDTRGKAQIAFNFPGRSVGKTVKVDKRLADELRVYVNSCATK